MNEISAKRLAVIRLLYEKGKDLSYEGEPMNSLCLLPFHDSVEMFMKLCADVSGKTVPRNASFISYFELLPDMQDKAQMDSLNSRRVSLKHHGQLSSSLDIEVTRVNVFDFFEHNMPTYFGCKLEEISLEVLIEFPEVRRYLGLYHDYLNKGLFGDAQAQCQIAFQALLVSYHRKYDRKLSLKDGPGEGIGWLNRPYLEANTDRYLETLKNAIVSINEAISIMNLGINYYSYKGFLAKGPRTNRWPEKPEDQYEYWVDNPSRYTAKTANDCYQFVINTTLKLQGTKVFMD